MLTARLIVVYIFLLAGSNGAHSVALTIVPFNNGGKEPPVVPSLRSKVMAAAAILHGIVRDVGCDGPMWMQAPPEFINTLT